MCNNPCLQSALWLQNMGCSVIPIEPKGKRPNMQLCKSWKEYQDRRATEEEIRAWFDKCPDTNIGLVCGEISHIVAMDVDGEKGHEWFKANMPKPNWFQFTSNKHKFHAFYKHPADKRIPPSVKLVNDEIDIRGDGSYVVFAPSVHPSGAVYRQKTLDGFDGLNTLIPFPDDIVIDKDGDTSNPTVKLHNDDSMGVLTGERNETLTRECARLYAKGENIDRVLDYALGFNARHCDPPLSEKEVETIVRSMSKTHGRNNPEALNAGGVAAWVESIQGDFTVQDVYRDFNVSYAAEKAKIRADLKALVERNIIEAKPNKAGAYRKKDLTLEFIDFTQKQDSGQYNFLNLPLKLSECCDIKPKNIITLAGETNAGKTAMLFNFVAENMATYKIRYLTSEMTQEEIQDRMDRISHTQNTVWQNVQWINRTRDYADAIAPDMINIVDFLEIYDNFSLIGAEIKKIFDKLTTGIAVIAIQKKKGETYGRGGEFTLEKARLALSLFTHGHLNNGIIGSAMVTKCKAFRNSKNPDGKECFYTLTDGYKYSPCMGISDASFDFRFFPKHTRDRVLKDIQAQCVLKQSSPSKSVEVDTVPF